MKNGKEILVIAVVSVILTTMGFILDLNERIPDTRTNVIDLLLMTALLFGVISVIYFPIKFLLSKLRNAS